MNVLDVQAVDPDERAEREVLNRLQEGTARLADLDHDCATSSGETFAAACRLSRRGRVAIKPLEGGRFRFRLRERGQVHPRGLMALGFVLFVLLVTAVAIAGGGVL